MTRAVILSLAAVFAVGSPVGAAVDAGPSLLALCLAGTVPIGTAGTATWSHTPATLLPVVAGVWQPAADRASPLVPAALLRPGVAALLYGVAIWAWHVPRLYGAALRDGAVHLLMIGSLTAVALLFWQTILEAARRGPGAALAAAPTLLATLMHTGMLGALLVFSPGLWFPVMAQGALLSGMSPLEDQQLAGLITWVPMGLVYMAAALALVARGIAAPLPVEPSRPA